MPGRWRAAESRAGEEVVIQPVRQAGAYRAHRHRRRRSRDAQQGDAVTLTFAEEVDVSRGDIIAGSAGAPSVADQMSARLIWFDEEPMLPGRAYTLKCGCQATTATVSNLKYKLNVDNLDHVAGKTLELNEVGLCNLTTAKALVFDPYAENTDTGSFILIDRFTNATVAAGMIEFGLRRATNVQWQELSINKSARAGLKEQKPCVLWFTGLSGAGKSTIANTLEKRLHAMGRHTYLLDGDNVRHGLNKDLGFTDVDRVENIRRVAEAARLFVDAGLIVMVSFISPFRSERRMARDLFDEGEFIEVFVDTPLEICEARDPKGLYVKARAGLIRNFTGIDSLYEPPEKAELKLDTSKSTPEFSRRDGAGRTPASRPDLKDAAQPPKEALPHQSLTIAQHAAICRLTFYWHRVAGLYCSTQILGNSAMSSYLSRFKARIWALFSSVAVLFSSLTHKRRSNRHSAPPLP